MSDPSTNIRKQNDQFRRNPMNSGLSGKVVITQGISTLSDIDQTRIYNLVRTFDEFSEDNDPHGEHDFGAFDYQGQKIFWKIDYYNIDYTMGSENPADPTVTRRVLTIMFAHEY